ncbi:hypothetical protein SPHINGO391_460040 [Sphingomonas aurantiaca]|uniref:Uncharacterized protein n=1 Tax=Sphingomonas aurantiaca TaxID=185949 RepID=A0A5E7ZI62_9SPHN|nr:hypothetical protein SPHINGO391_460040 [Sphingomonas aurantiaca]
MSRLFRRSSQGRRQFFIAIATTPLIALFTRLARSFAPRSTSSGTDEEKKTVGHGVRVIRTPKPLGTRVKYSDPAPALTARQVSNLTDGAWPPRQHRPSQTPNLKPPLFAGA